MLVLIMLTFSCHALCNCQGARGSRSEPSQPDAEEDEMAALRKSPEKGGDRAAPSGTATLLRLHPPYPPHLRRLRPFRVRPAASGADDSGGVTGGVYKARERIHRGMLIRDY